MGGAPRLRADARRRRHHPDRIARTPAPASFYARLHAPTIATSGGTILLCLASILCFAVLQSRWVFHEVLIIFFVTVTTPVTLMLLGQATLYRDRFEEQQGVPRKQKPAPGEE